MSFYPHINKSKANVEKLVACSNSNKDIERHIELIYLISIINKKNIWIHFRKVQRKLKCKEQMRKLFIS